MSALLAASIGNVHTVLGLVESGGHDGADGGPAGRVVAQWRVSTDERRTEDEWAVLLRGLLRHEIAGLDDLDGIVFCSTVPTVLRTWRAMLSRHFSSLPAVVVEPGIRTGIPILVDNPRELGTDRIVNAVAASTLYGGPVIVVDFTAAATIVDVVNGRGQYVGGAIAPGIEISLEALSRRGAQLRMVELTRPRSVIARNTVEALQSGLLFGVAAQVEGLVGRMVDELGAAPDDVRVVAAGYLSSLLVDECRVFTEHEPWLSLLGLRLVFDKNR